MASSLSTLSKNVITPGFDKFRETSKHFFLDDTTLATRRRFTHTTTLTVGGNWMKLHYHQKSLSIAR